MDTEKSSWPLWAHVASGILVAAAVLWLGTMMVFAGMARVATEELQKSQQAASDRAREGRDAAAKRERDRKAWANQVLNQQLASHAQTKARERHRERAWQVYFRPADECLLTVSVACGNAHMRAKKEFDRKWKSGEL